jgi:hypothetical protein
VIFLTLECQAVYQREIFKRDGGRILYQEWRPQSVKMRLKGKMDDSFFRDPILVTDIMWMMRDMNHLIGISGVFKN